MRAAPAVTVTIPRSVWWTRAVVVLASLSAVAALLWALSEPGRVTRWAFVAAALLWGAWLVRCERRADAVTLRWDRQQWHLRTAAHGPFQDPVAGQLEVMLDLDHWMLLRFRALASPARKTWIAAQRAGLERDWHALRCAVYSPRPSRRMEADASISDSASPPP